MAESPAAAEELAAVRSDWVRLVVELQAAFGLRREEAIKLVPGVAIRWETSPGKRDGELHLRGSWCKGGRPRWVPILTERQEAVLRRALEHAVGRSMIPADRSYRWSRRHYGRETAAAGLRKLHRLRHTYACDRFVILTASTSVQSSARKTACVSSVLSLTTISCPAAFNAIS